MPRGATSKPGHKDLKKHMASATEADDSQEIAGPDETSGRRAGKSVPCLHRQNCRRSGRRCDRR